MKTFKSWLEAKFDVIDPYDDDDPYKQRIASLGTIHGKLRRKTGLPRGMSVQPISKLAKNKLEVRISNVDIYGNKYYHDGNYPSMYLNTQQFSIQINSEPAMSYDMESNDAMPFIRIKLIENDENNYNKEIYKIDVNKQEVIDNAIIVIKQQMKNIFKNSNIFNPLPNIIGVSIQPLVKSKTNTSLVGQYIQDVIKIISNLLDKIVPSITNGKFMHLDRKEGVHDTQIHLFTNISAEIPDWRPPETTPEDYYNI